MEGLSREELEALAQQQAKDLESERASVAVLRQKAKAFVEQLQEQLSREKAKSVALQAEEAELKAKARLAMVQQKAQSAKREDQLNESITDIKMKAKQAIEQQKKLIAQEQKEKEAAEERIGRLLAQIAQQDTADVSQLVSQLKEKDEQMKKLRMQTSAYVKQLQAENDKLKQEALAAAAAAAESKKPKEPQPSAATTAAQELFDLSIMSDMEEARKVSKLQGDLVLQSSMIKFKQDHPSGTFEEFLQQEWEADYTIYKGSMNAEPGLTRSYADWIQRFDSTSADMDLTALADDSGNANDASNGAENNEQNTEQGEGRGEGGEDEEEEEEEEEEEDERALFFRERFLQLLIDLADVSTFGNINMSLASHDFDVMMVYYRYTYCML
jgi:hypothetical protein